MSLLLNTFLNEVSVAKTQENTKSSTSLLAVIN